jgi:hypothetical protein
MVKLAPASNPGFPNLRSILAGTHLPRSQPGAEQGLSALCVCGCSNLDIGGKLSTSPTGLHLFPGEGGCEPIFFFFQKRDDFQGIGRFFELIDHRPELRRIAFLDNLRTKLAHRWTEHRDDTLPGWKNFDNLTPGKKSKQTPTCATPAFGTPGFHGAATGSFKCRGCNIR